MNLEHMFDHYVETVKTQAGIQKYVEAMAQVLAEAGRASSLATGDSPQYAVKKWIGVIQNRALELLREQQNAGRVLEDKTKQIDG